MMEIIQTIQAFWPSLVMFVVPAFIGLGYGLGKATQIRIEKKRIRSLLDERDQAFVESFAKGRQWLAEFVAEAREEVDKSRENELRHKKHPARKSADIVAEIRREKRILQSRLTSLEYQIKSYEEYFPFLEEYREAIIDERAGLQSGQNNIEQLEATDPVRLFLENVEYEQLSSSDRDQLALDRYRSRSKSNWEIGRVYERYLGYLYEADGWKVSFQGAIKGYEDFGRDLICEKNSIVDIVQAKCWSQEKLIREKHIFQLFGTTIHYRKSSKHEVRSSFISTTDLSPEAIEVAAALSIRVVRVPLKTDYPMIKCNISRGSGEMIYHLPFDQQYDRVQIGDIDGERYASTVAEAESLGFRRAWKYQGAGNSGKNTTRRQAKRK